MVNLEDYMVLEGVALKRACGSCSLMGLSYDMVYAQFLLHVVLKDGLEVYGFKAHFPHFVFCSLYIARWVATRAPRDHVNIRILQFGS